MRDSQISTRSCNPTPGWLPNPQLRTLPSAQARAGAWKTTKLEPGDLGIIYGIREILQSYPRKKHQCGAGWLDLGEILQTHPRMAAKSATSHPPICTNTRRGLENDGHLGISGYWTSSIEFDTSSAPFHGFAISPNPGSRGSSYSVPTGYTPLTRTKQSKTITLRLPHVWRVTLTKTLVSLLSSRPLS